MHTGWLSVSDVHYKGVRDLGLPPLMYCICVLSVGLGCFHLYDVLIQEVMPIALHCTAR